VRESVREHVTDQNEGSRGYILDMGRAKPEDPRSFLNGPILTHFRVFVCQARVPYPISRPAMSQWLARSS
jgi:hypothetical protein